MNDLLVSHSFYIIFFYLCLNLSAKKVKKKKNYKKKIKSKYVDFDNNINLLFKSFIIDFRTLTLY